MSGEDEGIRRQRATWSAGDFTVIAGNTVLPGELLCESVGLRAGQKVLDVATGTGNTALSAARRLCVVTGVDLVPSLLDVARKRAEVERLTIEFKEGVAEDIPCPDRSFDAVLSTFGCMFAADQQRAADELLRVCKPGGKIGLNCWTPDGYFGQLARTMASYAPPPPNARPPTRWGTEDGLRDLLGGGISSLQVTKKAVHQRSPSPAQLLTRMKTYSGTMITMWERLDEPARQGFTNDFVVLAERLNESEETTIVIPMEYLEVVAVRSSG